VQHIRRRSFGRSMQQIAQLIKAGVGLEVAFTDTGNDIRWDTHTNEGGGRGQLAGFLRTFSQAIAAFATDLGKRMDDVVVLTMSEFGRTAAKTADAGPITDTRIRCSYSVIPLKAGRSTEISAA
jgi:uncharacterized protein (DUF1501 family)